MLIIGIIIGLLCRTCHVKEYDTIQKDTVTVEKKVYYSRLELKMNTCRIDVPNVDIPEYVFFQVDSIIYKDKLVYASARREYYYTKVDEAEIWHSGIGSRIDSLSIVSKTTTITERLHPVTNSHALSIGVEMTYMNSLYVPIYLEYEHMLHKNIGFHARLLYDLPTKSVGASLGAKLKFGW